MALLRRAGRRTNAALLVLLVAALVSGVLAFGVGDVGDARLVTAAHGVFGLGLVLLVPWKSLIIRRGVARAGRWRPTAGVLLGLLLALVVAAGVLHAVGGYHRVSGVTVLTVHVTAAVLALPFLVVHARGRRQGLRRTDLSRRTLLRAGAFGLGSLAAYGALEATAIALGLPGRDRRATGSHEVGSGDPSRMPVTQWFTDSVPGLSRTSWRVEVDSRWVPYADLTAGRDTVRAVLDCTGGWFAEQEWRGMRLGRLLAQVPPGTRSVDIVSVTGYRRRLPLQEVDQLLLATHAADEPLSDGHGGPVRLVAPGRRGFWWVKWVQRIEVTSQPWWLQPPFPLQ